METKDGELQVARSSPHIYWGTVEFLPPAALPPTFHMRLQGPRANLDPYWGIGSEPIKSSVPAAAPDRSFRRWLAVVAGPRIRRSLVGLVILVVLWSIASWVVSPLFAPEPVSYVLGGGL